ncbi:copper oxidase [[Brevibacterium] flavum]|uniref:Copper oxidase n=1 Tax=[Brevibacterium] flavum TaxID=92706 RepID=A0A0F6Z4X0_9CORY|nr:MULTISPECIES: multicopper oxidase domain-containing protein [Corynebacterium]AKF26966.1 copper oxidase [[Brevibacterium] flavum]ANE07787.1 copper oxidase [Corynebacterium glutamicum]AST20202.1 copper oxidase [Corynebacterium glutamicum ATCC 14067]KEI22676.1 copper oxidase [Corynebacterium glutamicum ATCC 14067]KIH74225.1 copper oxidase [Corynebacterium glutamicum]
MLLPELNRRTFFKGAGVLAATVVGTQVLVACSSDDVRGYGGEPRALPIPPADLGTREGSSVHFALEAQTGESQILPDVTTKTWGFNGTHLGPTLVVKKGDDVHVDVTNNLDEMTTVHWHGMKLPAIADGGPHSPIGSGQTWSPTWTVANDAATLWYHPHTHGLTGLHAYRGLAGMIIVEDEATDKLDLPHDYGVDDIPLVLMDHRFLEDGSLDEEDLPDLGLLGDTPTANGITNAHFDATTRRVRFRVLNGSNMRFYNLAFSDKRTFQVIASDSGLLDEPQDRTTLAIGPGERWEIVVDLEPGEDVTLESVGFEDNYGVPDDEFVPDFGMSDSFQLLTITGPSDDAAQASALPGVLVKSTEPDVIDATERTFIMNTFSINDLQMDMQRVDVVIDHDQPEVWIVTNDNSDWPHNFHVHDARFKVLKFEGTDVELFNDGWKDTVGLPPGATATLAVEFGYYPDPQWPYMYHCHMLYHEDQGMMGQFVIVEPGDEPAAVLGSGTGSSSSGASAGGHAH